MKTSAELIPLIPIRKVSLGELSGFALFCLAAFSPSILHLAFNGVSLINPSLAFGPLLAGFCLASSSRGTRLHFITLGTAVAALLWAINWLMMAEAGCCQTLK